MKMVHKQENFVPQGTVVNASRYFVLSQLKGGSTTGF